jgi:hypothetical protein
MPSAASGSNQARDLGGVELLGTRRWTRSRIGGKMAVIPLAKGEAMGVAVKEPL